MVLGVERGDTVPRHTRRCLCYEHLQDIALIADDEASEKEHPDSRGHDLDSEGHVTFAVAGAKTGALRLMVTLRLRRRVQD